MADSGAARQIVRREVLRFLIPGLIGMLVLTGLSLVAAVAVAREQSQRDAEMTGVFLARSVVEPRLSGKLIEGDPSEIAGLDSALVATVEGADVLGLRIWDSDGVVVYADDPRVIGETFEGAPTFAAGDGVTVAPADTTRPENRYLDPAAEIVEVSLPVAGADGRTYTFQVHQLQDQIREQAREIWLSFVPVLVGSLLLMGLLLGMLAVRMAGRISADMAERQELLQMSLQAGELERGRIAAQLHDGTVQQLVGLSFTLAGLSSRSSAEGRDDQAASLAAAAEQTRSAVRGLRSLLVDIYPANLDRAGLPAALEDLAPSEGSVPEGGPPVPRVVVRAEDVPTLSPEVRSAVYRIARESVANAVKHAAAQEVTVTLGCDGGDVVLRVADDGVGFVPGEPEQGHLGLIISRDVAESVGGSLDIDSDPGHGAVVTFRTEAR